LIATFNPLFVSLALPRRDTRKDRATLAAAGGALGSIVIVVVALLSGEGHDVHPGEWSTRSIAGLIYLITFGSLLAYSSYAWLLQNAPISKVSTYAYVNPVVAIALGWLFLDEGITPLTLVGAGVIVASVALVIRSEAPAKT
jgi:drug/metabolite transporter (DMT)-like permease